MSDGIYPVVKKVSLAGLSEEWDDTCFAYVTPATYADQKSLAEKDVVSLTDAEQIDYQLSIVKDHFISGKIRAFNGTSFEETDMTAEHTAASVELNDHLYAAIMGLELDPKAIRKAVEESALQTTDAKPTETTLSEE